jgi:hypothetical protein
LLDDDSKYFIREVPSLIVFYDNRRHKVYVKEALDRWLSQVFDNARRLAHEEAMRIASIPTPIPEITGNDITQKITPMNRPMSAPGKPKATIESSLPLQQQQDEISQEYSEIGTVTEDTDDYQNISGMGGGSVPAIAKKATLTVSPSELAKQMMAQRDSWSEKEESSRPFM